MLGKNINLYYYFGTGNTLLVVRKMEKIFAAKGIHAAKCQSVGRRKITVNKDKCLQCGLCEKLCPVGNIEMKEYLKGNNSCQVCMRCISFCLVNANLYRVKNLNNIRR